MAQSSEEMVVLAIIFCVLPVVFLGLRIFARRVQKVALEADDYTVMAAMLFFIICLIVPMILISVDGHLGDHVQRTSHGKPLPPSYLYSLCELIIEFAGYLPLTLAKCSILLFYKRIFRGQTFSIVLWATFGLVVAWGVTFFFASLFQCIPVALSLRHTSYPSVKCLPNLPLAYSAAISDFVIDIIILVIPWPFVWKLHMPTRIKVAVIGVFCLGVLTVAASVTRMVTFVHIGQEIDAGDDDYKYFTAPTVYWTMIESSLSIISACLPTLRPLFHGHSPESIVRSVRSMLSLASLRSHSRPRPESLRAQETSPTSSTIGIKQTQKPFENLDQSSGYHHTTITSHDFPLGNVPAAHNSSPPHIFVQKGWSQSDHFV